MKISIVTPTYNREALLPRLYDSIVDNSHDEIKIEWLIMDDGSTDNTKVLIDTWREENKIEMKYFFQENQGKMAAINHIIKETTGDLIVECDSDDYFSKNAFEIIQRTWEENKEVKDCYAMCFLKYNQDNQNMFFGSIRKRYCYELQKKEKFVTEASMYYKMDLTYQILCINEPIMICEYQEEGYSNHIEKQFKENPYGYYEYFKEILKRDFKGVKFYKRLYVIKHYILFGYLTKQYQSKPIKNWLNKVLYYILLVPGLVKSSLWAK